MKMSSGPTGCFLAALILMPLGGQEGPLKSSSLINHAENIGKMIKIKWQGDKLALDRAHWKKAETPATRNAYRALLKKKYGNYGWTEEKLNEYVDRQMERYSALEAIFNTIQEDSGAYRRSSSLGNNRTSLSFGGQGLMGRYVKSPDQFTFMLEKESGHFEHIKFESSGSRFNISLRTNDGDFFFMLDQSQSGAIRVVLFNKKGVRAESAPSYAAFYKKHKTWIQKEIIPILKHVGIIPPLDPEQAEVVNALLSNLNPLSQKDRNRYLELLADLEDESPRARMYAKKSLHVQFAKFQNLIKETIKKKSSSEALLTLLRQVQDNNEGHAEIESFIKERKLAENTDYLVTLFKHTKEKNHAAIIEQLKKITGQALADRAAWEAWQKENTKKEK